MNDLFILSDTVLLESEMLYNRAKTEGWSKVIKWHPAEIGNKWNWNAAKRIKQSNENGPMRHWLPPIYNVFPDIWTKEMRFRDRLSRIPLELRTMIAEYAVRSVIEDPKTRTSKGRWSNKRARNVALSLACRDISQKIRPRLFEGLRLSLAKDVQFLRQILRSNLSGWLGPHIQRLTILYENEEDGPEGISFEILASLLNPRFLTTLKYLELEIGTMDSMSSDRHCFAYRTLGSRLKTLKSLTHLKLISPKPFPSFSAFAQLLGPIPSLEDVQLSGVTWKSACKPTDLPDCNANFHSIKHVTIVDKLSLGLRLENVWPFAWLFAPSYTGYNHQWRGRRGQNGVGTIIAPPEICIMMKTAQFFLKSLVFVADDSITFTKGEMSGDVRILYVNAWRYPIQYNWQQPSHNIPPLRPNRSYRISEIIFWRRRTHYHNDEWAVNLDEYDSLLQDAPHLQNPQWDAQDAAGGILPPFKGRWKRYNPFDPSSDNDSNSGSDSDSDSDADSATE